ncbi:MAG: inosine/xanthosine triphosphatase [Cyclobacteriaceae bacterium]|nr:inosine/xanthosine triphosphatase [Cyclobacteriaceae bacterium]
MTEQNTHELKVYIGSQNPVKIACTALAFQQVFDGKVAFTFIGESVPSGVNDQPHDDDETYQGAYNRALELKRIFPDGSFFVGIEGGIEKTNGAMNAFAWIVVLSDDMIGKSRTATFQLPLQIDKMVEWGLELGDATDILFNDQNTKIKGGTVGQLTSGIIDRTEYYRHAVVLALIPFVNTQLYT